MERSNSLGLTHSTLLSLPILRILKAEQVPSEFLANLIKNTKGHLSEISLYYIDVDIEKLIQAIYQNCPNLRYLKLSLRSNFNNFNSVISIEFEKLLINCQFLNGLVIDIQNTNEFISWDKLFEILAKSSPINLFKFKFYPSNTIELEHLKSFFDNWKNRKPMLLKLFSYSKQTTIGRFN